MKWFNHGLIAGSMCAVIAPPLVPVCLAGATAPDWFEYVFNLMGKRVKHRGVTHVFSHWFVAALFFTLVWDHHGLGAAFAWGGVSHILTDAMTVSGVPFSPYSDRRFHLFGGRFRTGDPAEYLIAAAVVLVCITLSHLTLATGFAPFFYDWSTLYQQGLIDGLEWKNNRFRLI